MKNFMLALVTFCALSVIPAGAGVAKATVKHVVKPAAHVTAKLGHAMKKILW